MARIHILDSPTRSKYNAVVHFAAPGGVNEVGVPWKTILLEQYPNPEPRAFSDEAERVALVAGDIVEIPMIVELEPSAEESGEQLRAKLEVLADKAIVQWLKEPQRKYAYYGYSQGEVT